MTILTEAFRLFRDQGYQATTVEQIAAAAEVAPSTVFRYFPTKEDLVVLDRFPPVMEALRAQPSGAGPFATLRGGLRTAFASLSEEELAAGYEREAIALAVPELIAANIRKAPGVLAEISEALAERTGLSPDDPRIRDAIGATFGIVAMIWLGWLAEPRMDGPEEIDRALARLSD